MARRKSAIGQLKLLFSEERELSREKQERAYLRDSNPKPSDKRGEPNAPKR